jgi:hypothetical protein
MTTKPIVRTTSGLRDALLDEIDNLRAGKSNPQTASALSKLSVQVINTVRLEIEYQKHVNSTPDAVGNNIIALNKPIALGS